MENVSETKTLTVLDAPMNGKVYLVGTAHFSLESQQEVIELIRQVEPNVVVLELCNERRNILTLDEEAILKQSKEMNISKTIELMKQTTPIQGIMQSLLITLYAKITKELGFAPGGEFRVAYNEAKKIKDCRVVLGDMPIKLTLSRGFSSLPWYRKLKLIWSIISTDTKITKEDIEEMKKGDILDNLLKELGAEFPEFKKVLIDERNIYLTNSLREAYQPIPNEFVKGGFSPACVVGVVGLGHVPGIKENWEKELDLTEILKQPPPSNFKKYFKITFIAGTIVLTGLFLAKRRLR
jgi:pheromone shutdown protein TraB